MCRAQPHDNGLPVEAVTEDARESSRQTRCGDPAGRHGPGNAGRADPAAVEAVEQEASNGPEGRDLAREQLLLSPPAGESDHQPARLIPKRESRRTQSLPQCQTGYIGGEGRLGTVGGL
jgi:hypothetical protein